MKEKLAIKAGKCPQSQVSKRNLEIEPKPVLLVPTIMFKKTTTEIVRIILKSLRKLVKAPNLLMILFKSRNRLPPHRRISASRISSSQPRTLHMAIRPWIKIQDELTAPLEVTIIPLTTRFKESKNKTTPSTKIIILKSRSQPLRSIQRSSRLPTMNRLTHQCVETLRSPTTRDRSLNHPRSYCLSVSLTSPWTRRPLPSRLVSPRFSQRPHQLTFAQSPRASKASSGRTTWGRASSNQESGWRSKTRNTIGELQ